MSGAEKLKQYVRMLRNELASQSPVCSDCGIKQMPITGCYCNIIGKETMQQLNEELK